MKSCFFTNSKTLGKLLKRYKLITRRKEEISKEAQKRSTNFFKLSRLARKIAFKDSTKNKNKQL